MAGSPISLGWVYSFPVLPKPVSAIDVVHQLSDPAVRTSNRRRPAVLSLALVALVFLSCTDNTEQVTGTPEPPEECPAGQIQTPTGCEEPPPEGCPTGQVETPSGCVEPIGQTEPDLPDLADAGLEGPLRVRMTPSGRLLIADSRARMVFVQAPDAITPGQGFEVSGKPLSVTLLGDRIYVGVEEDQVVRAYQAVGGEADASFEPVAVGRPADMVGDTVEALLFVLDGLDRSVKVLDADGALVRTIGAGTLGAPTALGLDPARRRVLVSDYGSIGGEAVVRIFGYDGSEVGAIDGTAEFSRPQGAAVDGAGRVYVADALLASVLVYDGDTLEQVGTLGGRGTGSDGLRLPTSVAIDPSATVFVASFAGGVVGAFPGGAQ